jgi:hypothetical protein
MTQDAERARRSYPENGVEASSNPLVDATPVTWEEFSADFDRCFNRVYAYVSRRTRDVQSCERIVGQVLEANLDLLAQRGDDRRELRQLKAASDRLIALEAARDLATGTLGS